MFVRPRTYKPISGAGVKATIPSRVDMQPWEVGYLATDIQIGEYAYNADDKIWYQRTSSGIKETFDPDFKKVDGSAVLSKRNISDFSGNESGLENELPIKISGIKIELLFDESLCVKDGKLSVKDTSQVIYQNIQDSLNKLSESLYSSIQRTAENITLSVNQKIWGTDVAGPVLREEYKSAISQTAKQIDIAVNRKIWGVDSASERALTEEYKSATTATAEKITLEVDQKISDSEAGITQDYQSLIEQTASSIDLSVNQKIWGTDTAEEQSLKSSLSSRIDIEAGRIGLVVDSSSGTNTVKAGVIVDAINGSSVTIAAERVNIAGAAIFTELDTRLDGIDQTVLGKLDTGSAAADINGHQTTIHGGKVTAGTITSLGLVESFTGLFVKDDTAPGDHYVYGVTKSSVNGKLYPKMFLGERRTWNYASTTDVASGFIVERDTTDDKYKFHIGDNLSYLNYDGAKLRLGGVTLTEIVDGIPTDIYKIINGTVVFQLPLASISDISAYSSLTPPPTSWWDGLSVQVDQTTIGYINGKLTVLSAPNPGVSSWNELLDKPSWLQPTTLADFQNAHNHNALYHPLGGAYDKDFSVRNLTIYGEVTEYQAQVIVVDNAFMKLNTGNSEVDAGIIVETNDTDDARLFYKVSENAWKVGEGGVYGTIWDSRNLNRSDVDFTANKITLAGGQISHPNGVIVLGGNLHIDSYNGNDIYLNYYSNRDIRVFGNTHFNSKNVDGIANLTATEIYSNDWFRSNSNGTGWYSQPNETGIHSDAYKQVRVYSGGSLVVDNYIDSIYSKFGDVNHHKYQLGTDDNFSGMYLYDETRRQYVLQVRDSDGWMKIKYGLSSEYGSIYSQDNGNGYIELATYAGSLPGYSSSHYATIKSNSNIHFAPLNTYVSYISEDGFHVVNGKQFINNSDSNGFKSQNYHGLVGDYDQNGTSSKIIWTIGDSWNTISTHYGLGYEYYSDDGHNYVVRDAGTVKIKLGGNRGDIWGAGELAMNGNIRSVTAHRSPSFKIVDANNTVLWTLKADASGNLEFRNAADALVMLLTTAGKLSAKDDVEGFNNL